MPLDIEHIPLAILLMPDEWREVLAELRDIPELRGKIMNQFLNIFGPEYRDKLAGV